MGLGITIGAGRIPDPDLTQRATQVLVEERLGMPTRFTIVFPLDIENSDLPLLADQRIGPGAEVLIVGPDGQACLVHGVVHAHRIALVTGGEGSSLEVIGTDMSIKMDRESKIVQWPNPSDSEAAALVMAQNQLVPDVAPTTARHLITQNTLIQRSSDLQFIHMLAKRNGFLFWVTSDVLGIDTGHFKRPALSGSPAQTLSIKNTEAAISSLEINWDIERPTSAAAFGVDASNKAPLKATAAQSPLEPLGAKPLSVIAPEPRKAIPSAAANDAGGLTARAEAELTEDGWFITAQCKTTPEGAGGIVRAHTIVQIDGAGTLHSGNYLVGAVTHRVGPAAHVMDLTLLRNAWG